MPAKKIQDRGEVKKTFSLTIESKFLENQDHDKLRFVACEAIRKYVESQKK